MVFRFALLIVRDGGDDVMVSFETPVNDYSKILQSYLYVCISGLRRNCDLEYSGDLDGGEHLFHSGLVFIKDIPTHTNPKHHFRFAHQLNTFSVYR